MKTHKNLWPQIVSWENLVSASQKARRGKRNCVNVNRFEVNRERELIALQRELENHAYRPGSYRQFTIYEYKPRLISAAPYRDRVVHHALCKVIEPIFERTFIHDSYACRRGKGTHAAADRYTEFSRKNRYTLKFDIARYFDSIDHGVLYEELERKIADPDALWLLRLILVSQGDDGLLWPSGRGIPIGNLTSQFFANVYLNRFDHWMKEEMKCRSYIRYVDDMVVLSDDKRWLHDLLPPVSGFLEGLGLKIHPKKCQVFPVSEGCDFMGYRIWPDHRRLRKANGYRFARRWKRLAAAYRRGLIEWEALYASLMSWIGHASHANSWGLREKTIGCACLA